MPANHRSTDSRSDVQAKAFEPLEPRTLLSFSLVPELAAGPAGGTAATTVLVNVDAPGISGVIERSVGPQALVTQQTATEPDGSGLSQGDGITANLGAFTININASTELQSNQAALDAFMRAAAQWEAFISDPITVNIDAGFTDLGNANVIGQTGSVELMGDYSLIRNAMVADGLAETDDAIVNLLPTIGQVNFDLAGTHVVAAGDTESLSLSGTKANLKALGFTGLDAAFGAADAEITFNSTFAFDFDSSDGISAGMMDFETVAAHEIGHALGFISAVDYSDVLLTIPFLGISPTTMDMFRFADDVTGGDPTTGTDFTTFARNLEPGTEAVFDSILTWTTDPAVEWNMSTGRQNGDGRQASHWKDGNLTGTTVGMLDPTLAFGQTLAISNADLRVFDLIGYDIARPGSAPTNQDPVADAGSNDTVDEGDSVQLDGSGSFDPDGDAITYAWQFTSVPAGSSASFSGADTATPTFIADVPGEYVVELTVSDGSASDTATVTITAQEVTPQQETVTITKASYNAKKSELTIEATASEGASADLVATYFDAGGGVLGSTSLNYNNRKATWSAKVSLGTEPTSVEVVSISGASATATLGGGDSGDGGSGNGKGNGGGKPSRIVVDQGNALVSFWLEQLDAQTNAEEDDSDSAPAAVVNAEVWDWLLQTID